MVAQTGVAAGSLTFDARTPESTPSDPDPETWTWHHDEHLLMATLSTEGTTESVVNGETRNITVHADYFSWGVFFSNYGNSMCDGYSSSPAIGGQIAWSVVGRTGTVVGDADPSVLDENGNATATFTMGAGSGSVRADVSYDTSNQTFSTLSFAAPGAAYDDEQVWTVQNSTLTYYLSLGADGDLDGLAPGTQRTIGVAVTYSLHEESMSDQGNWRYYDDTGSPATTPVAFSLDFGNGSIPPAAETDANGNATSVFVMGSNVSRVRASVGEFSEVIDFNPVSEIPETWDYAGTTEVSPLLQFSGGATDLFPGATGALSANVTNWNWEVWTSNLGGRDLRNPSSPEPVFSAAVAFSIFAGEGIGLSEWSALTDVNGNASVSYTMGEQTGTVQASSGDATAAIDLVAHVPIWSEWKTESSLFTSLSPSGENNPMEPNTEPAITAQVTYDTWQVRQDDSGRTEFKDRTSSAAINAIVGFSLEDGDGIFPSVGLYTDQYGDATAPFIMGERASRVRADVSYGEMVSTGTLDLNPDSWEYLTSGSSVGVILGADSSNVIADVTLTTWDIYKQGDLREVRNLCSAPASNVHVDFFPNSTPGLPLDPALATSADADANGIAIMPYAPDLASQGNVAARANFYGMDSLTAFLDANNDGIPDFIAKQYGITNSSAIRYIGGQTDHLTYKQAYDNNLLGSLVTITFDSFPDPLESAPGDESPFTVNASCELGTISYQVTSIAPPIIAIAADPEIPGNFIATGSAEGKGTFTVKATSTFEGTILCTAVKQIQFDVSYPPPETAPSGGVKPWDGSGDVDFQLYGQGGKGPPYTFQLVNRPPAITAFDSTTGSGTYHFETVGGYAEFKFTVNDGKRTSKPGTATVTLDTPESYPPSVSVFGHRPGTASEETGSAGGKIIAVRPNDDHDEGRPGADNEDSSIGLTDDDITQVSLNFSRGLGDEAASSGKLTIKLPTTGFQIYTSATGGTRLSGTYEVSFDANDTITDSSGHFAPLITAGRMVLYVETAPGALQSGEIEITTDLKTADELTSNASDAQPSGPSDKSTLLPAEFTINNIGNGSDIRWGAVGFDPPIFGDPLPGTVRTGNVENDAADWVWWTSVCRTSTHRADANWMGPDGYPELNVNKSLCVNFISDAAAAEYELIVAPGFESLIQIGPQNAPNATKITALQGRTNFGIKGLDPAATHGQPKTAEIWLVRKDLQPPKPIATLKVAVLPEVRLTIGIYFAQDHNSPVTEIWNDAANRARLPKDDVLFWICSAFQQACITFTPAAANVQTATNATYDTNKDGRVNGDQTAQGGEYNLLSTALQRLASTDVNVAFVYRTQHKRYSIPGYTPPDESLATVGCNDSFDLNGVLYPPDEVNKFLMWGAAHEIGHALGLSTRNMREKPESPHDNGPFPDRLNIPNSLMTDADKLGELHLDGATHSAAKRAAWLRHEDWFEGNDNAKLPKH